MGPRTLMITLGGLACLGLVACLGYGSPIDESDGELGTQLPQRAQPNEPEVPDDTPAQPKKEGSVADAGTADTAPPIDAAKKPLRVFVSSALRTGTNIGGLAQADALCTQLATAANLGGTYRAWLSVNGTDAVDHVTSAGPWQLVSGEIVADNKAGLTSGTLKHLIDKDEKGATPPLDEDRVWTATGANGRYTGAGTDCGGWTGAGNGQVGEARNTSTSAWTTLVPEACSEVNRIYCFEL